MVIMIDTITISPIIKTFLAGSFSGTCSTILFQPLDLVKTRIQSTISTSAENGMVSTFGKVVEGGHVFALWKGMTPSILRCVPGVGLYFSSLHVLKTKFCDGEPTPLTAAALGMGARTLTGILMIPMTVVKTRYESTIYGYKGVPQAVKMIYMKEGVRGLTCGLLPTLLRDAPFSGLYLMFYTQTKQRISATLQDINVSATAVNFSCGIIAGILASGVTQPFDVLKTKMQLYPDQFSSLFEAAIYVHTKYGVKGFVKGLAPRMLRRTLMAAMAWTVYEQTVNIFGLK